VSTSVLLETFDAVNARWFDDTPTEPAALGEWQLTRAWHIADRLAAENPFYRARLRLPTDRTAAAFRTLPATRKDDVVADCEAHPPYGTRTVASAGAIRMTVQTSGTSGRGTEVFALDDADEAAITRTEATGFLWAGVGPGTKVLLSIPVGMTAAGMWYYAALRAIGANVLSVGSYPTERKVAVLAGFGADMIVGTPSYVQRLAVACEDAGIDPASLGVGTLMVAGETYSIGWAKGIEQRWGARLYEQYGCTERAIAWTCPGGVVRDGGLGVLHFPPESGYYEVIDRASGDPVADGKEGELIVTPFGAAASPLLRYATGDKVRWAAPGSCECRRTLAGIAAGAVMRLDDMMKVRGVNVWPATFDTAVFSVPGVVDYRGRIGTGGDGSEIVEIRIEAESTAAAGLVTEAVQQATGLNAAIAVVPAGTLAREVPEGFVKIKRWNDERRVR